MKSTLLHHFTAKFKYENVFFTLLLFLHSKFTVCRGLQRVLEAELVVCLSRGVVKLVSCDSCPRVTETSSSGLLVSRTRYVLKVRGLIAGGLDGGALPNRPSTPCSSRMV